MRCRLASASMTVATKARAEPCSSVAFLIIIKPIGQVVAPRAEGLVQELLQPGLAKVCRERQGPGRPLVLALHQRAGSFKAKAKAGAAA